MNAKEALQKIKDLLLSKQEIVEETHKFNTLILKDGKKIAYDLLEAGSVISNLLEDNSVEDLSVGEYEMEDGSKLIIDEFSKLVEIKQAEVVVENAEEMPGEEPEMEPEVPAIEERVASIEDRLGKIEEALNMILETMSGQNEEMSAIKSDLAKRIEAIEKAPATEPVHYSKVELPEEETVAQRRARALDFLKK
jgi:hypothetical protein